MTDVKSQNEFYDLINKDKILVDFYADWCAPCRMMDPILEDVDSILVVRVNVDKFRSIAKEYKVLSIPALKIFSYGKVLKEAQGFMSRDELNKFITE